MPVLSHVEVLQGGELGSGQTVLEPGSGLVVRSKEVFWGLVLIYWFVAHQSTALTLDVVLEAVAHLIGIHSDVGRYRTIQELVSAGLRSFDDRFHLKFWPERLHGSLGDRLHLRLSETGSGGHLRDLRQLSFNP